MPEKKQASILLNKLYNYFCTCLVIIFVCLSETRLRLTFFVTCPMVARLEMSCAHPLPVPRSQKPSIFIKKPDNG